MRVGPRRSSWAQESKQLGGSVLGERLKQQHPHFTHLVGQQEALDGSADGLQVGLSPHFKRVLWGRQELGAHFLQQEAVLGRVQGAEAGHLVASHLNKGQVSSPPNPRPRRRGGSTSHSPQALMGRGFRKQGGARTSLPSGLSSHSPGRELTVSSTNTDALR